VKKWLILSLVIVACAGRKADTGNKDALGSDAKDVKTTQDTGIKADTVCKPGEFLSCSDDNRGKVVCSKDGSEWVVESCGEDSLCLNNDVGCTKCVPGKLKCLDEKTVGRCDEKGEQYNVLSDCNPDDTGRICKNGSCVKMCEINAKAKSYIGCEYWGVDLDNAFVSGGESGYLDAAGSQYAIVVSNPHPTYKATVKVYEYDQEAKKEVEVTLDSKGNPLPAGPLMPMSLRIFNLPRRDVDGTILAPLAYRVESSIPITAYEFNPLENVKVYSNDASILLPSDALGKYYIVMTREQTFNELKGFVTVTAVYPSETQVTITVTAPTLSNSSLKPPIPALKAGESITRVLHRYDVLNIETNYPGADLTGTVVQANHPVVVFGGSEAANAPNTNHCCPGGTCDYNNQWMECKDRDDCLCEWPIQNGDGTEVSCHNNLECLKYNTCCADHLEMQMFPVKTWGTTYIAARSYPRSAEKDDWRILAAKKSTKITTYPTQTNVPVLNAGEWIDFESADNFIIKSAKPILVGQFLEAQDAPDPDIGGHHDARNAGTGDPSFILSVPVEQFRKEYVFIAPNKYKFDCVNIITPVGANVYLDKKKLLEDELKFKTIQEINTMMNKQGVDQPVNLGIKFGDYRMVGDGKWAVWRLVIADGVHTVTSDQPVGVISYGYDRYVSYGYPAGLNLQDLKLFQEGN